MGIIWLSAAVAGVLFRQVMGFQWGLAQFAERMARHEDVGLPPITYQNSITPPWIAKAWIVLVLIIVGLVAFAAYSGGLWDAGICLIAVIGGIIASGVASHLLSRPSENAYYEIAFHNLVNRAADYRRDGDLVRADAADEYSRLMIAVRQAHADNPSVQ